MKEQENLLFYNKNRFSHLLFLRVLRKYINFAIDLLKLSWRWRNMLVSECFHRIQAILQDCTSITSAKPASSLDSAISCAGKADIFYTALEMGYPCIKLQKDPIPEKGHANDKDRAYCARGQMLVLGPWEIKDANDFATRFGDADSMYAKFHNLNSLAAELCNEDMQVVVDKKTLEECR